MIQINIKIVIVRISVPRRIVTFPLSVTICTVFLRAFFIHVQIAAGNESQRNDIRIVFSVQVHRNCKHLLSFIYVQIVSVRSDDPVRVKGTHQSAIFLTHLKLAFDFLQRTVPSVIKPRRKFLRTIFAKISILQFPVSQHADFFSTYIAVFFVKNSHC